MSSYTSEYLIKQNDIRKNLATTAVLITMDDKPSKITKPAKNQYIDLLKSRNDAVARNEQTFARHIAKLGDPDMLEEEPGIEIYDPNTPLHAELDAKVRDYLSETIRDKKHSGQNISLSIQLGTALALVVVEAG